MILIECNVLKEADDVAALTRSGIVGYIYGIC